MIALVTGGGGFLGGAIVRQLLGQGDTVRSLTRSQYPWLDELGVQQIQADLGNIDDVRQAMQGCDVVFHTAAKAGVWGRYQDYYQTNVLGTQNVIKACQMERIGKLVYTSTPSVVHSGGDLEGIDESYPYPDHFEAAYPETKAIAEKAILAANGPSLSTVALRPHLIWGPGDPHLIPRVLAKAKAGKLRRIGKKPVMVDVTYIDNVAQAHLCAAKALSPGSHVAGKAYFITNDEPMELWEFLNQVLALAGIDPVTKTVSPWLAKTAGVWLERIYRTFGLAGEPPMTRFVASQLSTAHWYNISAAKRDFGYNPKVTIAEGLAKLAETWQQEQSAVTPT